MNAVPPPRDDETPSSGPPALIVDLTVALRDRYALGLDGDPLVIESRVGPSACRLLCRVGSERRTHEIELFIRDVDDSSIDGGLGLLVDFLDQVLVQFFENGRDAYLPLDFVAHPYEGRFVQARMELRDLVAERMADELLGH